MTFDPTASGSRLERAARDYARRYRRRHAIKVGTVAYLVDGTELRVVDLTARRNAAITAMLRATREEMVDLIAARACALNPEKFTAMPHPSTEEVVDLTARWIPAITAMPHPITEEVID